MRSLRPTLRQIAALGAGCVGLLASGCSEADVVQRILLVEAIDYATVIFNDLSNQVLFLILDAIPDLIPES